MPTDAIENVHASSRRYQALQSALDLIDQGITLINEDLELVAWNQTFLRLLDFPAELAYERAPFEGFIRFNAARGEYGPGDLEAMVQERIQAARGFGVHDIERVRPDGTILSVRGVPVPGHGFVTLYSDITEQRRREQQIRDQNSRLEARVAERTAELHDSNRQLQALVQHNVSIARSLERSNTQLRLITDSIPALVGYFGSDRRYHYVNRGYHDWFGLDVHQPERINARVFLGPDTYDRIRPYVMRAVRGEAVTFEYEVMTLPQRQRVARTSLIPELGPQGEVMGCFELTFDITDERKAHERLARAQKMEALGQLTGGLSHDFNNILTVVLGNLQALAEIESLQPYRHEYLQPAINAAQRGSDLIRGLLSFSRKHPVRSQRVRLQDEVERTLQLLRHTLPASLELHSQLAADALTVCLDPNQLQDALINLVLNARDATEGRGTVQIIAEAVSLDERDALQWQTPPGPYARLRVVDDGCGMDQDTLSRVFEPFFSTKATGQGTGLGMAMVYGFVQQSNGVIDIRSEAGQGSCIALLFPLLREDRAAANAPATPHPANAHVTPVLAPSGRPLALLVEDEPSVRQLVRRELLDMGYGVLEAESAHEAIDILDHTDGIQLLLSDVVMPGEQDGRDVVRHAQRHARAAQIVLMSGYVPSRDMPDDIPLLSKPFSRQQLQRCLQGDVA